VGDTCQNEGLGLGTDEDVSKSQSRLVSQSPSKSIFHLWRRDGKTLGTKVREVLDDNSIIASDHLGRWQICCSHHSSCANYRVAIGRVGPQWQMHLKHPLILVTEVLKERGPRPGQFVKMAGEH